jgi:uncharacterized protein YecT (DUF1311 family)
MSRAICGLALLLAVAPVPAKAQSPSCAAAATQTEMNACTAREYQQHDAAMNDIYQRLLAKLADPRQKTLLQEAERAWIAYRDKQCAFQSSGTEDGSIHPLIVATCLDEKTTVHTAELNRHSIAGKATLPACTEPRASASVNPGASAAPA